MWNEQLEQHLQHFEEEEEEDEVIVDREESLTLNASLSKQSRWRLSWMRWRWVGVAATATTAVAALFLCSDERRLNASSASLLFLAVVALLFPEDVMMAIKIHRPSSPVHSCYSCGDRARISERLGQLGAPPLSSESLRPPEGFAQNHETNAAAVALEACLQGYSDLLVVVEQALDQLQVATCMHLGLGHRNNGGSVVDRVERASVGRAYRQQQRQDKSSAAVSSIIRLPLSTLRNRLYQLLDQQCRRLRLALTLADKEGDASAPPVLTLTLLRSQKMELVNLLGQVVDHKVAAIDNSKEDVLLLWNQLAQHAAEARAYLEACLHSAAGTVAPFVGTAKPKEQQQQQQQLQAIDTLLGQVQGLDVTLQTLREELVTTTSSSSTSGQEWWQRVLRLTEALESNVKRLDEDCFAPSSDSGESGSSPLSSGSCEAREKKSREETGDYYTATTASHTASSSLAAADTKKQQQHAQDKTMVFLVGEKGGDDKNADSNGQSRRQRRLQGTDPEEQLLLELESRLLAMPVAEEEAPVVIVPKESRPRKAQAINEQQVCPAKEEESAPATTTPSSKSQIMTAMIPPQTALLFQGELAASLAGLGHEQEKETNSDHVVEDSR